VHRLLSISSDALEQGEALAVFAARLQELATTAANGRHAPEHPAVRKARGYIREHWQEDFTLADLASEAQLSPFHLCRCLVGRPGFRRRHTDAVCVSKLRAACSEKASRRRASRYVAASSTSSI
jgi:hypothetical protein